MKLLMQVTLFIFFTNCSVVVAQELDDEWNVEELLPPIDQIEQIRGELFEVRSVYIIPALDSFQIPSSEWGRFLSNFRSGVKDQYAHPDFPEAGSVVIVTKKKEQIRLSWYSTRGKHTNIKFSLIGYRFTAPNMFACEQAVRINSWIKSVSSKRVNNPDFRAPPN